MKKSVLKSIIIAILAFVMLASFTGCDYLEEILPDSLYGIISGHHHVYVTVTTAPTCTTVGYDTKTCSTCGKVVTCNETPAIDHQYPNEYETDDSSHWKKCNSCDKTIENTKHTLGNSGICFVCDALIGDTAGIIYRVSEDGTYAEVSGYRGTSTRIKIAKEYNGLPVTEIGFMAFYKDNEITSVVIPDSVTSISWYAFCDCNNLTSVVIPDSVTYIGYGAFHGCDNITYTTYEGARYLGNADNMYLYLLKADSKDITSCTIHPNTRFIGDYAFSNCDNLTSVTIPDGITDIGDAAFKDCDSLTSVTIPDSVTSIGDSGVFEDCDSLTSVTIGNGVTYIGGFAFSCCTSLTSVTIGNSVTFINEHVFQCCTSLTSINFKGTVEQWRAIEFWGDWNYKVPATEVGCSDGTVRIK